MRKKIRTEVLGAFLAIAVCAALFAGCAKIGEPQPPEVRIPRAATDLAAHQLADSVVLKVTKPSQNKDGSPVATLASVDLYRSDEQRNPGSTPSPLPEDQFAKRAVRILTIPSSKLADYLQGDSIVIQDKLDLPDRAAIYSSIYRYAVLFINKKNQAAGFSNQAVIAPVAIPPAPSGLSAKCTESYVSLKWNAPSQNMDGSRPPRIAGFKIYRAEGSGELQPVSPDLVRGPAFEDRSFQFGKLYRYAVRTVGSVLDPYAESGLSEIVAVQTRDVFPPAPPQNFHAIREEGSIILLWTPSPSADVAGYRVYRQDKKSGARLLLQKELITVLNCRDNPPAGDYIYALQAVDANGNESELVQTEVESR